MSRYTTIFIVDSAHDPTNEELKNVSDTILSAGKQQGFEPWLVKAVTTTGGDTQVIDRITYTKWARV
jgi:hypothetical protein